MQDDPLLFDYNVEERVNDFVAAALAQVHQISVCLFV
jgi:alpha-mannosidase